MVVNYNLEISSLKKTIKVDTGEPGEGAVHTLHYTIILMVSVELDNISTVSDVVTRGGVATDSSLSRYETETVH